MIGIDVERVTAWLVEHVGAPAPFRFDQLLGGSSNLTFRVTDAEGGVVVLRRPPANSVLASAHDMAREHRVMAALEHTAVPVPRMLAICADVDVTGAVFYVMEHVDGLYMEDAAGAGQFDEAGRRRAADSLVDGLAALHQVDPDAVGLGDLGRREGYVARQLKRWFAQWEQMHTVDRPEIRELHAKLVERLPAERSGSGVVHGDYSFRNCRFAPDGQLRAVLDWEISTLGDPLADLGYLVSAWSNEPGALTSLPGFPSSDEVVARYSRATGFDVSPLPYYLAFNHWKAVCIMEGVYARYQAGALGEDRKAESERFPAHIEYRLHAAQEALS